MYHGILCLLGEAEAMVKTYNNPFVFLLDNQKDVNDSNIDEVLKTLVAQETGYEIILILTDKLENVRLLKGKVLISYLESDSKLDPKFIELADFCMEK